MLRRSKQGLHASTLYASLFWVVVCIRRDTRCPMVTTKMRSIAWASPLWLWFPAYSTLQFRLRRNHWDDTWSKITRSSKRSERGKFHGQDSKATSWSSLLIVSLACFLLSKGHMLSSKLEHSSLKILVAWLVLLVIISFFFLWSPWKVLLRQLGAFQSTQHRFQALKQLLYMTRRERTAKRVACFPFILRFPCWAAWTNVLRFDSFYNIQL